MPTIRGVVITTYFADDQGAHEAIARQADPTFYGVKSVACDVLTYGSRFRAFLPKVPVVQARHGLNDYDLWKPRGTQWDLGGAVARTPVYSSQTGEPVSSPKDLDGDHVLVEFAEGDVSQPFIRSAIAHPRAQYRQTAALGDAREMRYRGVVVRIDNLGNVAIDTTHASAGRVDETGGGSADVALRGEEVPALQDAADAANGGISIRMNHNAPFVLEGVDLDGVGQKYRIELDPVAKKFLVRLDDGSSFDLTDKGPGAIAIIGNGAVKAAIADHLQSWYATALTGLKSYLDTHIHSTGMGPSGPPSAGTPFPAPGWDPSINSAHLKFPDGF